MSSKFEQLKYLELIFYKEISLVAHNNLILYRYKKNCLTQFTLLIEQ